MMGKPAQGRTATQAIAKLVRGVHLADSLCSGLAVHPPELPTFSSLDVATTIHHEQSKNL